MATGRPADEASFSAWALDAVDNYERCRLEGYSEADCCEAFEALSPRNEKVFYHMDQLLKSLHVHWLEGWLAAFPRESVLVLRLEDWKAGATNVLRDTLRAVIGHLDLAPASEALLDQMVALPVRRFGGDRKPPTGKGVMEPATLQRLRTFFAPFNHRLASLLGDDKWRWGY